MSRIDELVAKLCPDGVEYWKLGDVATIGGGHTPSKKDGGNYEGGTIPWVTSKDVKSAHLETTGILITEKGASSLTLYPKGTIIAVLRSGILKHTFPVALLDVPMTINQDIKAVCVNDPETIDPKYLFQCIDNYGPTLLAIAHRAGGTVDSVPLDDFKSVAVPVPPMEIQREIIRILDTFTSMTDELTAKLAEEVPARKQQYEYYRNCLLSPESLEAMDGKPVEMVTLGDIAEIGTGSHDTKDAVVDGAYRFYARGVEPLRLNEFDFDETAIITAGDGAGVGKVFHFVEGKYALHQRAYRLVPEGDSLSARYLYHVLRAFFYDYIMKNAVQGSVASVRRRMLDNFPVPLPSLATQQKVVDILDRFDVLTTSLTDGLPAEIEARRQQYEYYRNRLLDFPKKEVAAS